MRISAVVPAFNNQETLDECLKRVASDRSVDEIVVVDDGSDPPLKAKPRKARIVRLESAERRNRAAACNHGARSASGEFLFFIDSNKIPRTRAVQMSYENLLDMECSMGVEHMITSRNKFMPERVVIDHGSGAFMRKASFLSLGGYDSESFPRWGFEGYDFSLRWLRTGRRIYTPDNIVSRYVGDPGSHRDMAAAERDFLAKWGMSRDEATLDTMRMMV